MHFTPHPLSRQKPQLRPSPTSVLPPPPLRLHYSSLPSFVAARSVATSVLRRRTLRRRSLSRCSLGKAYIRVVVGVLSVNPSALPPSPLLPRRTLYRRAALRKPSSVPPLRETLGPLISELIAQP
ncbi:hypothetical protein PIB30_072241 [Stylosanthes scabra]|uniref:Uncharacterized protein n=1 Tax=Stylosanthes scabra TaxID=79078 RepID=A0ABU6VP09_9FABA|nr:hypothetical protein [Stylosanthes scabra]